MDFRGLVWTKTLTVRVNSPQELLIEVEQGHDASAVAVVNFAQEIWKKSP